MRHDQAKLSALVVVDQVFGTTATLSLHYHWGRPDYEYQVLSSVKTEATEGSRKAMQEVLGQLLTLYANRLLRAKELSVEPF